MVNGWIATLNCLISGKNVSQWFFVSMNFFFLTKGIFVIQGAHKGFTHVQYVQSYSDMVQLLVAVT